MTAFNCDYRDLFFHLKGIFGLPDHVTDLEIRLGNNVIATVNVTYIVNPVIPNETCRKRYRLVELDGEPDSDAGSTELTGDGQQSDVDLRFQN